MLAGNPSDYSRSCRIVLFPAANLVGTGPKDLCEPEYGTQLGGFTLFIYILSFRVNFLRKLGETAGEEPKRCLTTFSKGRKSKASLYWLSNDYYSFMFVLILQRLKDWEVFGWRYRKIYLAQSCLYLWEQGLKPEDRSDVSCALPQKCLIFLSWVCSLWILP